MAKGHSLSARAHFWVTYIHTLTKIAAGMKWMTTPKIACVIEYVKEGSYYPTRRLRRRPARRSKSQNRQRPVSAGQRQRKA